MSHIYFGSDSDSIITSIVRTLLNPPGARTAKYLGGSKVCYETGVLIDITLEVYDDRLKYEDRENTKSMRHYFMAFCGNTNVFVASRDKGRGNGLKWIDAISTDEWINLGNHDSCWSDSVRMFLNETRGEMGDEVNPEAPLRELDTICDIGFAGCLWKLVEITTGPDPERDSYWRKLVDIKYKR